MINLKDRANIRLASIVAAAMVTVSMLGMPLMFVQPAQAVSNWETAKQCLIESTQQAHKNDDTYFTRCVNNQSFEGMVYRAYHVVLGREPDVNGFNYLSKVAAKAAKKDPTKAVVDVMMRSNEYRNKIMTENTQLFVAETYQRAFRTAGDKAGIAYWTNRINSINSNRLTQERFLRTFVQTSRTKTVWSLEAPCFITGYNEQYCAD